ncbi:MAG: hypothetical protein J3K34DRAFT_516657 [Monoraphidium minutum]|nr:MAG: hypothetical protein J3K34DRAFT_516657 [Monoraphidium minutum]
MLGGLVGAMNRALEASGVRSRKPSLKVAEAAEASPLQTQDEDDEDEEEPQYSDDNEAVCGGCRLGGELICCEACPAAFHARCTGFASAEEVPDGDWFCWFCAAERGAESCAPSAPFRLSRLPHAHVMLASDDMREVFYRTRVVADQGDAVELQYVDIKHPRQVVQKASPLLWHGTTDKAAWSLDEDGLGWRPNSRLFKVDTEALEGAIAAAAAAAAAAAGPSGSGQGVAGSPGSKEQLVVPSHARAELPPIRGGADEKAFMAAYSKFWQEHAAGAGSGGSGGGGGGSSGGGGSGGGGGGRGAPRCQIMVTLPVPPWRLWQEVHSWGGPEVVTKHKLWAACGGAFDPPPSFTMLSTSTKTAYTRCLAALDEAIDAGRVALQRPERSRFPEDRRKLLAAREAEPPAHPGAAAGPSGGGRAAAPHAAAAAAGAKRPAAHPQMMHAPAAQAKSHGALLAVRAVKAARLGATPAARPAGGQEGPSPGKRSARLATAGVKRRPEPGALDPRVVHYAPIPKRLRSGPAAARLSEGPAAAAGAAAAEAAAGEGAPQRGAALQLGSLPEGQAIARARLTPAALGFKAGDAVDFRRVLQQGGCASGWQAGVLLRVAQGSDWEGGLRLLARPADEAGGGGGGAAASPQGRRREAQAGGAGTPAGGGASGSGGDGGAPSPPGVPGGGTLWRGPVWLPLLWRGPANGEPFAAPLVLVRPRYDPGGGGGASGSGAGEPAAAGDAGDPPRRRHSGQGRPLSGGSPRLGPGAAPPPTANGVAGGGGAAHAQAGGAAAAASEGARVEVLRHGCWWPARVEAGADAGGRVLLRNAGVPEGDGLVWHAGTQHAIRPAPEPGHGVLLQPASEGELLPRPALQARLAAQEGSHGIRAFACLDRLLPCGPAAALAAPAAI